MFILMYALMIMKYIHGQSISDPMLFFFLELHCCEINGNILLLTRNIRQMARCIYCVFAVREYTTATLAGGTN